MPAFAELVLYFAVFLTSLFLTKVTLNIAPKVGLVCKSNDRSSHTGIVPRGGGVGFILPFLIVVSALLYLGYLPKYQWIVVVICGGFIAALGLWDDKSSISAMLRLFVQLVCVSIGVWVTGSIFLQQMDKLSVEVVIVAFCLSVLAFIWLVNLYNFMDGIDGIAASEALFIAVGAVSICWLRDWFAPMEVIAEAESIRLLLLLLSASIIGFLVFNWAPAKIFMGDTGSTFLGFVLGMIALSSILIGVLSISVWLILGAVFLVDATYTLMRRILASKRWYTPHRSHAYQHAVSCLNEGEGLCGGNFLGGLFGTSVRNAHGRVCLLIITINLLWLFPLGCVAAFLPELEVYMLFIAWAPLVWIAYILDAGKDKI
jgi:Fuc2NAc and GlcNAc transferase